MEILGLTGWSADSVHLLSNAGTSGTGIRVAVKTNEFAAWIEDRRRGVGVRWRWMVKDKASGFLEAT